MPNPKMNRYMRSRMEQAAAETKMVAEWRTYLADLALKPEEKIT